LPCTEPAAGGVPGSRGRAGAEGREADARRRVVKRSFMGFRRVRVVARAIYGVSDPQIK